MQNSEKAADPSMEEILASIRKIISEEPEGQAAEPAPAGAPPVAAAPEPDQPPSPPTGLSSSGDDDLSDILEPTRPVQRAAGESSANPLPPLPQFCGAPKASDKVTPLDASPFTTARSWDRADADEPSETPAPPSNAASFASEPSDADTRAFLRHGSAADAWTALGHEADAEGLATDTDDDAAGADINDGDNATFEPPQGMSPANTIPDEPAPRRGQVAWDQAAAQHATLADRLRLMSAGDRARFENEERTGSADDDAAERDGEDAFVARSPELDRLIGRTGRGQDARVDDGDVRDDAEPTFSLPPGDDTDEQEDEAGRPALSVIEVPPAAPSVDDSDADDAPDHDAARAAHDTAAEADAEDGFEDEVDEPADDTTAGGGDDLWRAAGVAGPARSPTESHGLERPSVASDGTDEADDADSFAVDADEANRFGAPFHADDLPHRGQAFAAGDINDDMSDVGTDEAEPPYRESETVTRDWPSVPAASAMAGGAVGRSHGEEPGMPVGLSPAGSRTLEDTVSELLRPMLRDWLDQNMPRIVEKALRVELAARGISHSDDNDASGR